MARCFVAVWPPPEVVDRLAAWPRPAIGVRWLPSERWHVTLRFLGAVDPDGAAACLDDVAWPPSTATIGPVARRLGRDAIVLDVAGCDALAAAARAATARLVPDDGRPFVGHLTLARSARSVPPSWHERIGPVEVRFDVQEVVLAVSRTLPSGAEYAIAARWPVPPGVRSAGPS